MLVTALLTDGRGRSQHSQAPARRRPVTSISWRHVTLELGGMGEGWGSGKVRHSLWESLLLQAEGSSGMGSRDAQR